MMEQETHDSVAALAGAYAQKAVQAARGLNTDLDFSENSLMELEAILDGVARDGASIASSAAELTEVCKTWGSYFGEVVRRRFGGEWSIETYPGKQFATLTLTIAGNKLFPSMKVHRRLTEGQADNLWSFYKMIKTRLETSPGAQVQ
jgi:hypothetical protein